MGAVRSASTVQLVVWFGIAILLAYLLFLGGTGFGTLLSAIRSLSYLLVGLFLAAWFAVGLVRPRWRPESSLGPALLLCAVCFAIATAASWNSRLSLEALAYAATLIALYVALVSLLKSPFLRARIAAFIVVSYVCISVLYLVRAAGAWLEWVQLVGLRTPPLRPAFDGLHYGNPNELAAFAVLALATVCAHVGFAPGRRRWLTVALVTLGGVVIVVSGSRSAWLGIAAGSVSAISLP